MAYADLELALRRWSDDAGDASYAAELRFEVADSRAVARSIEGPPPRITIDRDALSGLDYDPRSYGERLTRMLFADARLCELFAQAHSQAERLGIPLRLRLRLDTADETIHSLLWETLQVPEQGGFLCVSERLLLSRYLESADMTPVRARARSDLKALVAVANPAGLEQYKLAPIDLAGEVDRCRAALAEIPTTVVAQGYGERATLNLIATALRDGPDILYLVCHGTLRDGRPYLWLENESGAIDRVTGEDFVARLEGLQQRPSLIVLVSCQSAGRPDTVGALAALGPRLAATGIVAVVAMQGNITMATAARFMPDFFRELRRDGQIDRALAAARAGVLDRHDWWMPVLFLRVRDGQLWSEPELPAPPEPRRPPEVASFIGREAELAYFKQQLATAHLAVITGMPGVGKTLLAAKLAGQLADATKIFWHTFHEDEGVDVIIWKLAGFLARNHQDELWRMLERARQTGGQPPPPEVLLDYLIQLLRGRGYLLCLDDFQCVDDDPLLDQFVERLRAELHGGTIALLVISRQMPAFAQEEAMALEGLSADDTNRLLVARGLALPPELAAELYTSTGGNAQIVTLAIDRLLRSRDPAALIARLSEADNIERYLMAEVDADLSEDERAVMVAVATLLGYGGTRDAIEAILDRGSLRPTLRGLCDRYLLMVTEREAGREYGQHAIVRAFYYDTLSRGERQALHRRAGEYYDTAEPNPLKAVRHFERAGDYARAARLLTGNFWALVNQGQVQALRQLLEPFTAQQLETEQWVSVCIARAEIHALLGESRPALERYHEALAHLAIPATPELRQRKARVYRGRALVYERTGAYDEAEAACRSGLELMAGRDLPNLEVARLYTQLANILRHRGNLDMAEQACRDGLAALPPEPAAPRERIALLQRLATLDASRGNFSAAIRSLEQSLALARPLDDPFLTAAVLHNLGTCLQYTGQSDRVLECYEESLRLKEQVGDAANRVVTINNLAAIYRGRGDYDRALSYFRECRDLCARLDMPEMLATATVNIGLVSYQQGQLDAAQESLQQARAIWQTLDDANNLARCLYRLGDVALARHDPDAAQEYGRQALLLARQVGNRSCEAAGLRVIGEALVVEGQLDRASTHLEQAWAMQEQIGDVYDQTLTQLALARLALAQRDHNTAAERARSALALAHDQQNPFLLAAARALHKELEP